MEPTDDGLVPFQKLDYDTEAIMAAAGDLRALADRIQRYDVELYGEIVPLMESGTPEQRADAAGRASCLSQEIVAEIEHLRAISDAMHRANGPDDPDGPGAEVARALSQYMATQGEPPLRALATKAQQVSTRLFWSQ